MAAAGGWYLSAEIKTNWRNRETNKRKISNTGSSLSRQEQRVWQALNGMSSTVRKQHASDRSPCRCCHSFFFFLSTEQVCCCTFWNKPVSVTKLTSLFNQHLVQTELGSYLWPSFVYWRGEVLLLPPPPLPPTRCARATITKNKIDVEFFAVEGTSWERQETYRLIER